MQRVNVFIETSSRFRGNVERKCGYVLSTQLRTGKETREHFGRVTGTYHQAILGQGLEPAPGTGHINNGMSGYHY